MNQQIEQALTASIMAYSDIAKLDTGDLQTKLVDIFEQDINFLNKVSQLDEVFDSYPRFDELREITFDLLLMNFFAADISKLAEDYLESETWESIENQTIDRGTELLNVLLYLRECTDESIEPQLSDYLKEFLLVDEDEFQDEYRIYEPVIANQLLIETSYEEIAKVARKIPEYQELAELFYPIMGFFYEQQPSVEDWETFAQNSDNPAFDVGVYRLLVAYHH